MRSLIKCVLAATVGLAPLGAHAETRALLAGSWKFNTPGIEDLVGPQNDLAAMEALVRAEGATDVTVLRNEGVTRTTFETALHALGLRAKPGDWIMIYYSGHGAEAEAQVKGTGDGDRDQFIPLAGFSLDNQDPEHFIVDKDFYAWISRYVPRTVQVVMIADTCHSGTLHRSIDPRAWRFTPRLAFRGEEDQIKLVGRPAPRFPAVLSADTSGPEIGIQRAELPNEIYLAAALDDESALEAEVPAEGAPSRGLFTYAFEQALTRYATDGTTLVADADKDGRLTIQELFDYVAGQVHALSNQRQDPAMHFVSGAEKLALFQTLPKPPEASVEIALRPALWVADVEARPPLANETGFRLAMAADKSDFVWDRAAGTMLRRSGDIVAEDVRDAAGVRGVIEAWNAMEALRPFIAETRARIVIGPQVNGARYRLGEEVSVSLDQAATSGGDRYATIFDVASDGTVRTLYPLTQEGAGRLAAGAALPLLQTAVVTPLGTDHVVAVTTPVPPLQLRRMLASIEGQRGVGRLVDPIKAALASGGASASLSIGELYTGR